MRIEITPHVNNTILSLASFHPKCSKLLPMPSSFHLSWFWRVHKGKDQQNLEAGPQTSPWKSTEGESSKPFTAPIPSQVALLPNHQALQVAMNLSLSLSLSLSPVIFCNCFGGTWQLQRQPSDNSMATSIQLSWEPKTLTCKWSPHQSAEEVERNTLMTMCFKLQFFCSFAFCEDGFHLWRA